MQDKDNAIDIMKAAMEKEKAIMEKSKESMDEQIDVKTQTTPLDNNYNNQAVNYDMEETGEECFSEKQVEIGEVLTEDIEIENTDGKQAKPGKSLFKNTKVKESAAKDQKIEELNDRLMRSMAEFDNFRKRSEKEKSQMYDIGVKSIVEKILPIVDNFERGFGTISEKDKESAFAQGIEMIYKQLLSALEDIGVKPIAAVGNEFNPALHNAVMHGEDESLEENIISDEFQKGYMYRDIVVRHSMVKVVN